MIEVEVKAKVDSFRGIREAIGEKSRFLGSSHQTDTVFDQPQFLDSEHKIIDGGIVARIREEGDRKFLEFKEIRREGGGLELRHEIKDAETVKNFLLKIGYIERFVIRKVRETHLYRDFLVCLDTVEKLGQFIEVERTVANEKDAGEARKLCLEILKEIAPNSETEYRKYGDMIQDLINKGRV